MKSIKSFIYFLKTGKTNSSEIFIAEFDKICQKTEQMKKIEIFNKMQFNGDK